MAMLLLSMLILAYSTILQFSIPSIILCFGEDGHIAFEQSDGNTHCIAVDNNYTLPVNNCKDLTNQKDDCQDIPLKNILSALYLGKDGKIKTIIYTVADTKVHTIKANTNSHFDINNEFFIIHSSIKSLQTTILII